MLLFSSSRWPTPPMPRRPTLDATNLAPAPIKRRWSISKSSKVSRRPDRRLALVGALHKELTRQCVRLCGLTLAEKIWQAGLLAGRVHGFRRVSARKLDAQGTDLGGVAHHRFGKGGSARSAPLSDSKTRQHQLLLLECWDDAHRRLFGEGGAVLCEAGERVGGLAGDGLGDGAA